MHKLQAAEAARVQAAQQAAAVEAARVAEVARVQKIEDERLARNREISLSGSTEIPTVVPNATMSDPEQYQSYGSGNEDFNTFKDLVQTVYSDVPRAETDRIASDYYEEFMEAERNGTQEEFFNKLSLDANPTSNFTDNLSDADAMDLESNDLSEEVGAGERLDIDNPINLESSDSIRQFIREAEGFRETPYFDVTMFTCRLWQRHNYKRRRNCCKSH